MTRRSIQLRLLAACGLAAFPVASLRAADPVYTVPNSGKLRIDSVTVDANAGLLHTPQFSAPDFNQAMASLSAALKAGGSDVSRIVRLNVYAADEQAAKIPAQHCPVTLVISAPPAAQAKIAVDAVAMVDSAAKGPGILSPGGATFISGQAIKGADMTDSARKTTEGLIKTLDWLKLKPADAVHLKVFLQPMSDVASARMGIETAFAPLPAPPISFVQWTMTGPIEIEMVAAKPDRPAPNNDTIEFLTPPWFKPSPVYSKVTVVHGGRLIFTSGLISSQPLPATGEVTDLLTRLDALMTRSGSDMKHLAKATYYPADEPTSKALNDLRPRFYDPTRAPAASKAPIRSTGILNRNLTLDLIAVTKP